MKRRSTKFLIGCVLVAAGSCFGEIPKGVPKDAQELKPGVYRHVDKDGKAWIYRKTPFGVNRGLEENEPAPDAESLADTKPESTKTTDGSKRMTPFGPVKVTGNAPAEAKPAEAPRDLTKVTEAGDTLRFERPTPFGAYRWTKKKTELTEQEKALWEAQRNSAAAQTKTK